MKKNLLREKKLLYEKKLLHRNRRENECPEYLDQKTSHLSRSIIPCKWTLIWGIQERYPLLKDLKKKNLSLLGLLDKIS